MMEMLQEKMESSEETQQTVKWQREALQMLYMNEEEKDEAMANIASTEEMITKLLALAYDQIQDEEVMNILKQLKNYRKLLSECILEGAGFTAFKKCKDEMSKEEKKKAVWEAFMRSTTETILLLLLLLTEQL